MGNLFLGDFWGDFLGVNNLKISLKMNHDHRSTFYNDQLEKIFLLSNENWGKNKIPVCKYTHLLRMYI